MKIPVYVVSLLRDYERRKKISADLNSLDIDFQFFDAIDAKDPSNNTLINSMKKTGIGSEMTDGEIACTLSHQLIFREMIQGNIEWAIILEDDVIIDEKFKDFLLSLNENEIKKLNKHLLYMLGGQKGLHEYPVLGLSIFNQEKISSCSFRRVNYNINKVRRTCCYIMNDMMAGNLLKLSESYGTFRADNWKLMRQKDIVNDIYLHEIISHPIVCSSNSHLEHERMQAIGETKKPRSKFQLRLKRIRSRFKVLFFSFLK